MSKFNSTAKILNNTETSETSETQELTNMAGGPAFEKSIKQTIATIVLNSMLDGKDSYYETELERLANIEKFASIPELSEFVAKAAIYTRTLGNLRSVSHFLAVILAENVKGTNYLRPALKRTFVRPDDLTETLALWNSRNPGKMVPNVLRRAFKDALETFDHYQLKKYSGESKKVKLRDVVKLSHPKGDFKALIEGTLPNIQTAQTVNAGSTGEQRAQNYKSMLQERKLGYMAALKNIKNILESTQDSETVNLLCKLLRNERACLNSKVLPFRFTQAYAAVDSMDIDRILAKKVIKALEEGFKTSARNISIVEQGEKVAILLDESGSMGYDESICSKTPFGIGKTLMASMLSGLDKSNTVGYLWADSAREVSVDTSPFEFIKNTHTKGGGTDVWGAISGLVRTNTFVDKIIILTDMQMYNIGYYGHKRKFEDMVEYYKSNINPNVKVVFWNLEGYSTGAPIQLSGSIMEVAGFSDKMLDVVANMLKYSDQDYLIKEIESIQL